MTTFGGFRRSAKTAEDFDTIVAGFTEKSQDRREYYKFHKDCIGTLRVANPALSQTELFTEANKAWRAFRRSAAAAAARSGEGMQGVKVEKEEPEEVKAPELAGGAAMDAAADELDGMLEAQRAAIAELKGDPEAEAFMDAMFKAIKEEEREVLDDDAAMQQEFREMFGEEDVDVWGAGEDFLIVFFFFCARVFLTRECLEVLCAWICVWCAQRLFEGARACCSHKVVRTNAYNVGL